MMQLTYFIVDAFISNNNCSGNPAGVCILNNDISQEKMQNIAKEFNFSETAFIYLKGFNPFTLRFFKPTHEVKICGHATLASAFVLFEKYFQSTNQLEFSTKFATIPVLKEKDYLTLSLDSQPVKKIEPTIGLIEWLNFNRFECYEGIDRIIVCIDSPNIIKDFKFDPTKTKKLKKPIVIITAKTGPKSYCYRYFTPFESRIEDPATGTAQMFLAPFWSNRLKEKTLNSLQMSNRTGSFKTQVNEAMTNIQGKCKIFSQGIIY